MYKSILQFIKKDIKEIEECVENLLEGKKDAADLSEKINESTRNLAAQFWKENSDLQKNEAGYKINTIMAKVICIYEDVIDEAKEGSGKHLYRLVGKHYFCGVHKGSAENYRLWQEVNNYIEATYDTEILERSSRYAPFKAYPSQ